MLKQRVSQNGVLIGVPTSEFIGKVTDMFKKYIVLLTITFANSTRSYQDSNSSI
jgi:hypothetical protein